MEARTPESDQIDETSSFFVDNAPTMRERAGNKEEPMVPGVESRKALAARRVIEVLEYFDEHNRHATVMDIARRYNRPQSSTSELLTSLVGLGLLYKDPASRIYTLTPRAAILGSLSQPQLIRDGRLSMLIDNLCLETGLGTALIGTVGLNAQLFRWKQGAVPRPVSRQRLSISMDRRPSRINWGCESEPRIAARGVSV